MSLFVFFISLLIVAQHVSGNHVPIIRSWRLRNVIYFWSQISLDIVVFCNWYCMCVYISLYILLYILDNVYILWCITLVDILLYILLYILDNVYILWCITLVDLWTMTYEHTITSVDKKNQIDVTFCILYFSSNSCSTCFGQPCAHHQKLTTAWCYRLVLVCAVAAGRWSSPVGR